MSDERDHFISLVRRFEAVAGQHPAAYRLRLGLLAILGYAYIFLVVVGLLGVLAGMVGFTIATRHFYGGEIKIFVFLLVIIGVILRSLWVTFPPPDGIEITRAVAPVLFSLVDDLCARLAVPRFHKVLLTTDFNAGVMQIPRLGIFGWYRNYLILGMPLLMAMNPEQFRAVLAHEMGHISGRHGHFMAWIVRMHDTWARINDGLCQGNGKALMFHGFLKWYMPYFLAYSFVLIREQEYEADREAAQLTSPRDMAAALVELRLRDAYLDKVHWEPITESVTEQDTPPTDPYSRMPATLATAPDITELQDGLTKALLRTTDYNDTHPALRDRLTALGYTDLTPGSPARTALLPTAVQQSAADQLLGTSLVGFVRQLDQRWVTTVTRQWRKRHAELAKKREELAQFDAQCAEEPATCEEAWKHAKLIAETQSLAVAAPHLRQLLESWPDHAPAQYALGVHLLQDEDDGGISLIEAAMTRDRDFLLNGCEHIIHYLKARGRDTEAETYLRRGMAHYAALEQAKQQAHEVKPGDRYTDHGQPDTDIASAAAALAAIADVRAAYFVRKVISVNPEAEAYLLAVKPNFGWFVLDETKRKQKLMKQLTTTIPLPAHTMVVLLVKSRHFVETKVARMPGACIYQRLN